ncbi:MAG: hypothetical protein ABI970_14775 [Chloroflexota bacterium]|nr:hypothetical protein [Anaerolineae bacterium]
MSEFPSALDVEFLSDEDLMDKITEIITVIEAKKSAQEDDQDEQEILEELEAEHVRRQLLLPKNNVALLDDLDE